MNFRRFPATLALAALGLTLAVTSIAQAQGPGRKGARGGKREGMQRVFRQLDLTDAQKDQIKPILKKIKDERAAIAADTSLSDDAKKEKLQELRKRTGEEIEKVLTPEQKKKWDEMKERAKKRGGRRER